MWSGETSNVPIPHISIWFNSALAVILVPLVDVVLVWLLLKIHTSLLKKPSTYHLETDSELRKYSWCSWASCFDISCIANLMLFTSDWLRSSSEILAPNILTPQISRAPQPVGVLKRQSYIFKNCKSTYFFKWITS